MNPVVSEIAQLRAAVESETIAASQGLSGLASVARHATITARMERIGVHHERLAVLVGAEGATQIVCDLLEQHSTTPT